jgi:hypothetical protein
MFSGDPTEVPPNFNTFISIRNLALSEIFANMKKNIVQIIK